MILTSNQLDILAHTMRTGRYVCDFPEVSLLVKEGYLFDYGPQKLAAGMHYLTLTTKGSEALTAHQATLPKPRPLTRSQQRYREFLRLDCGLRFGDFLKRRLYST